MSFAGEKDEDRFYAQCMKTRKIGGKIIHGLCANRQQRDKIASHVQMTMQIFALNCLDWKNRNHFLANEWNIFYINEFRANFLKGLLCKVS
jgi:hypothetical protein